MNDFKKTLCCWVAGCLVGTMIVVAIHRASIIDQERAVNSIKNSWLATSPKKEE